MHLGPGRRRAEKPGQLVDAEVVLEVEGPPPYVSRGGVKLANALDALSPGHRAPRAGRRCLHRRLHGLSAAARGGHVVALDVAYGELDWRLREDQRVTVLERANARALTPDMLPYRPELVVIDVSFISLVKVLPAVLACTDATFDCLAMVKPQFELGKGRVGKGGVVRVPVLRAEVVNSVAAAARVAGAAVMGSAPSALAGPSGNRETFLWLAEGARPGAVTEVDAW